VVLKVAILNFDEVDFVTNFTLPLSQGAFVILSKGLGQWRCRTLDFWRDGLRLWFGADGQGSQHTAWLFDDLTSDLVLYLASSIVIPDLRVVSSCQFFFSTKV
jgi:hypothetical protein